MSLFTQYLLLIKHFVFMHKGRMSSFASSSMPVKGNKYVLGKRERYLIYEKLLANGSIVSTDELIDAVCGLNDPPQKVS